VTAATVPPSGTGRIRGLIAINVTAIIFGTAALFGKLPVSPLWIIGVRSVVATVTLLIWGAITRELVSVPRGKWAAVAASAVIMTVSWILFYSTVQLGGVAIATLTFSTFPLFALLIDAWHLRRRPKPVELTASGAIFGAVYLVVGSSASPGALWGVAGGLGSAVLYAVYWHLGRSLRPELSETMISLSQSAAIAALVLPWLPFAGRPPTQVADIGWLIWFGAVNTALASQLYLYALRDLSASSCGAFVAMEPIYAITFAALIFHEPLSPRVAVGGIIILGASYLLSRLESDPASSPSGAPDGHEI
jgi:drug/metabolite transporter (DMT)-like permease